MLDLVRVDASHAEEARTRLTLRERHAPFSFILARRAELCLVAHRCSRIARVVRKEMLRFQIPVLVVADGTDEVVLHRVRVLSQVRADAPKAECVQARQHFGMFVKALADGAVRISSVASRASILKARIVLMRTHA